MQERKKILSAFISIFVLGLITGVALGPPILKELIGNPYSDDVVAKRVFNIMFIEDLKLPEDKTKMVDDIAAKYVSQYKTMKDKFTDQRFNLYAGFTNEIKPVLTEEEYAIFIAASDKHMEERKKYHSEKEQKWFKEREKSKYYSKDYDDAAKRIYETRIPTGTVSENNTKYDTDKNSDIYMQYMFDKKQNSWGTFDKSQEIKDK